MKHINRTLILICFISLYSCAFQSTEQEVKEFFIKENLYIKNEKDALKNEIDWFEEPKILECYKEKDLTGKDLIHLSNILYRFMEESNKRTEDDLRSGREKWGIHYSYPINSLKELGADNPDKKVAELWYLSGKFATYSKDHKFATNKSHVLIVPKLNEKIELTDYMLSR